MPIQAPQWTEFLSCPICCHKFDSGQRGPISLGCGHTVCRGCLSKLQRNQCPYDQTVTHLELDQLPVNGALLSLVNNSTNGNDGSNGQTDFDDCSAALLTQTTVVPRSELKNYFTSVQCIKELALLLKPFSAIVTVNGANASLLSRPMQRKLVTLINCQLVEEEGRCRALRAARSLGERTVMELILHHQNHLQLSANLWAAVRSRGCQFLGPAMQEEVLKLVLLALEDGSSLSRKVLVMFVVQRLEPHFPQASKTSIGHVVQLLYRASCFKVSKRECDSSLMQLKEEFRTYETLRREHDAQIVQIATEAGLRIAPDQWSSLLYGDTSHKSHMQSIIDKLQTPQSFGQSVQELVIALQRTGDPGQLSSLRNDLKLLANVDPSAEAAVPDWEACVNAMEAVRSVVKGLVYFVEQHGNRKISDTHYTHNSKYKTSMCRDLSHKGNCPRGNDCTFAHSEDELEKYRSRSRKQVKIISSCSKSNKPPMGKCDYINAYSEEMEPDSSMKNDTCIGGNGGRRGKVPIIVEELMQPHLIQLAAAATSQTVRPAPPTPVYAAAAPIAEYSFSPYGSPHQGSIFAQMHSPAAAGGGGTNPVPAAGGLTPSPTAPIYSPQRGHMVPGDTYPPAQHLLLNQGTLYNIFSHARDFVSHHIADTKQTKVLSNACVSSWPNRVTTTTNDHHQHHHHHQQQQQQQQRITISRAKLDQFSDSHSVGSRDANKKSLQELNQIKYEILNRLENIVGKEATEEVANKIEKGETVSTESKFSSMYNIWTTGANLSQISWDKTLSKSWDCSANYGGANVQSANSNETNEFIPFDPPIASRFGPISKATPNRSYFPPSNPIQVSASNSTDPSTTRTVHRPVPSISPVPQVLYQQGGYTLGLVSYPPPPPLEYMNTVGHGIIDPPHLRMSQLVESSGMRPSDPLVGMTTLDQEQNQRLQFIAAKEGIDAFCLEEKLQELRLKEELNIVVLGIQEKTRELEENNQDDLNDFERNFERTFDFDECDKD